jgi:Domain of Unknown Function (DUF1080)
MLTRFTSFLLATILLLGCGSSKNAVSNQPDNQLSSKEKSEGWQLLFDGSTVNGWHTYGKETAGKAWVVKDGALFLDADNMKNLPQGESGDLVTNDEYDNFHLKLDWKIAPKGNSGIIFYIHEDPSKYPNTYFTGLECQVLDNGTPTTPGHSDAKLYTHRAGDLYDLLASKDMAKPQGQWNHMEIKCVNGQLDFYMNGEHTLSTTLWDDNWKQMIAISKFKKMPGFGTFKKGKISLQEHGEDVWFKNIKIKRL